VAWVTGDTVYGHSRALRSWLEDEGLHHVLAVPRNEELWAGTDLWRVDEVHAAYGDRAWHRLSAGAGSKGERWYDWQCWILAEPEAADWGHYLLFRRACTAAHDWQAYVAFAPQGCDLETLVAVAGRRGCIEHAFEAAKQETGLDDYEVRSAHGWYRHVTLALWALALLAVVRAADLDRPHPQKKSPATHSLAAFKRARGLAGG
jgi:SRSO17 transposase